MKKFKRTREFRHKCFWGRKIRKQDKITWKTRERKEMKQTNKIARFQMLATAYQWRNTFEFLRCSTSQERQVFWGIVSHENLFCFLFLCSQLKECWVDVEMLFANFSRQSCYVYQKLIKSFHFLMKTFLLWVFVYGIKLKYFIPWHSLYVFWIMQ